MTDRLPHEKGFHVSWDQIHRDARALAWRLDGRGPDGGSWKAVVAITRGGMAPAMIVARELDIRTVDTISVMSYDHQAQSEASVLKAPDAELMGDGEGILVIDDLVDTGKTLELVRRLYPKAHFATVYAKPQGEAQVAITSGCNQAFCAAIATLAGAGDAVILPTPWYFNHEMWLRMSGIDAVPLPTGPGLLPDPDRAAALITPATRAIVLVSPNNPGGVEYPADLVLRFHELARSRDLALIVDETYRDFDSRPGPPHRLFEDPDWADTLIDLYSFSKAYRIPGHRVGAMIASEARLAQVEKFIDSVTICPNGLGQRAALWGLGNLSQWLAGERAEILGRRAAVEAGFAKLDGWQLLGCGGFFAYVEHPFDMSSGDLAPHLLRHTAVLLLPGTMFAPRSDADSHRQLRIAYANVDSNGFSALFDRLRKLSL